MDQYDRSPCIPFHFLSYVQSENKKIEYFIQHFAQFEAERKKKKRMSKRTIENEY